MFWRLITHTPRSLILLAYACEKWDKFLFEYKKTSNLFHLHQLLMESKISHWIFVRDKVGSRRNLSELTARLSSVCAKYRTALLDREEIWKIIAMPSRQFDGPTQLCETTPTRVAVGCCHHHHESVRSKNRAREHQQPTKEDDDINKREFVPKMSYWNFYL